MMQYGRTRIVTEFSLCSSFAATDSVVIPAELFTFTEGRKAHLFTIPVAGLAIPLGELTTVTECLVWNTDSSNYVTMTYHSIANPDTPQLVRIPAGKSVKLPDLNPAITLSFLANVAPCDCVMLVVGS